LAWFTLALSAVAIVQVILFVWQLRLIRKSLDDAKIAANAATVAASAAMDQVHELKRSADATERSLFELERAYISGGGVRQVAQRIAQNVDVGIQGNESVLPQSDGRFIIVMPIPIFEIHINNYGKTPARLSHVRFGFCDAADPPSTPKYEDYRTVTDFIGPGTMGRFLTTVPIPEGRFTRIAIFARFYWQDIWRTHRSSGFIYQIPGPMALPNGSIPIPASAEYFEEREERDET
jgi:hypothetical protein